MCCPSNCPPVCCAGMGLWHCTSSVGASVSSISGGRSSRPYNRVFPRSGFVDDNRGNDVVEPNTEVQTAVPARWQSESPVGVSSKSRRDICRVSSADALESENVGNIEPSPSDTSVLENPPANTRRGGERALYLSAGPLIHSVGRDEVWGRNVSFARPLKVGFRFSNFAGLVCRHRVGIPFALSRKMFNTGSCSGSTSNHKDSGGAGIEEEK